MSAPLRVFLVAGEASGDRLGAALMRGLRAETGGETAFMGVGGAAMQAEGFDSLFPMAEISVMGITEVLPRLRTILRRIEETAEAMVAAEPDMIVTIDAPDFGLRAANKARERLGDRAAKTLFAHYVAPSVWAWRPGRAAKMARRTDHLLALLPFEPPYFEAEGLSCDFVGHSVVEAAAGVDPDDRSLRAELGIAADAPVVVALPGSRRGEVERLSAIFGETLGLLARRRPGLQVITPAGENVVPLVREKTAAWPVATHVLDPNELPFAQAERRKFRAMAAADVALAASGTVSLELAAMRTPMAIGYRTAWLTAQIVRRVIRVDSAVLANLVTETRAVPEFLQEYFAPEIVAQTLSDLMEPDSAARNAQLEVLSETMRRLGEGDAPPSRRAARSLLAALERRRGGGV